MLLEPPSSSWPLWQQLPILFIIIRVVWWCYIIHYLLQNIFLLLLTIIYLQHVVVVVGTIESGSLGIIFLNHWKGWISAAVQDIVFPTSRVQGIINILIPIYVGEGVGLFHRWWQGFHHFHHHQPGNDTRIDGWGFHSVQALVVFFR